MHVGMICVSMAQVSSVSGAHYKLRNFSKEVYDERKSNLFDDVCFGAG